MAYAKLKGRIYEMELRQNDVARRVGLTDTQLSDRMRGKVDFALQEIYKMGEVLRIPVPELLTYFPRGIVKAKTNAKGDNLTHFPVGEVKRA